MFSAAQPADSGLPSPLTRFFGREQEIADLVALLGRPEVRLLTLTGAGGSGKTRLALEVASRLVSGFNHGVRFASFASLDSPDLLATEIARATGLSEMSDDGIADRLSFHLSGKSLLLILDSFDRQVDAAPLIVDLVGRCTGLKVLTTSRINLHVSGEYVHHVQPLELPSPEASLREIQQSSAARLFVNRARLQENALTPDDWSNVASICRHVDGLPLAIELAAANTRSLSLADLLCRLDQRLPLLTDGPRDAPPRHRSMREAIAWTYHQLAPQDQSLFRVLSIFEGGFTIDAAEAMTPEDIGDSILAGLTSLVDHHLINRVDQPAGHARYIMLDTIREFGLEQLRNSAEETNALERRVAWFCRQIESVNPDMWFDSTASDTERFPGDHDNLRSSLNYLIERADVCRATQIAYALLPFWRRNGLYREAADALSRLVRRFEPIAPLEVVGPRLIWAGLQYTMGDLEGAREAAATGLQICRDRGVLPGIQRYLIVLGQSVRWSDGECALELFDEALEVSNQLNDQLGRVRAIRHRAFTSTVLKDFDGAMADLEEVLRLSEVLPIREAMRAYVLTNQAWIMGNLGELAHAERFAIDAFQLSSECAIIECMTYSLRIQGEIAFARNKLKHAAKFFRQALRLVHQATLQLWEGFCYAELAMTAQGLGRMREASLLYGAAHASWDRLRFTEVSREHATLTGRHHPESQQLKSELVRSEFARGGQLPRAEVVALALGEGSSRGNVESDTPLTPRQIEVLALVAQEATNREIADSLFISERTVDGHIASILDRLGVESRRAAVSVARDRGLILV